MIKIPFRTLKFGPYQVSVRKLTPEDSKKNWGLYWPTKYQMDLHDAYPNKEKAAETFLHECFHVILEERGINLGKKEEQAVTEVSKGFIAFFRDNKAASRWLFRCLGII